MLNEFTEKKLRRLFGEQLGEICFKNMNQSKRLAKANCHCCCHVRRFNRMLGKISAANNFHERVTVAGR
jgi:hypothetical protein